MGIAGENSESVQRQKESLYTSALPRGGGVALRLPLQRGRHAGVSGDAGGNLVSADTGFGASVTRVLGSGADPRESRGGSLPLRLHRRRMGRGQQRGRQHHPAAPAGFGRLITLEPLRQSERDLIYAVRSYERFRRTFAVDVAAACIGSSSPSTSRRTRRRTSGTSSRSRAGTRRCTRRGELSRVRPTRRIQEELRSQNQLVILQGNVDRQLDLFKVFLGLPIKVDLTFEDGILRGS